MILTSAANIQSERLTTQHDMGEGVHIRYDHPFSLSPTAILPLNFHFTDQQVKDTFVSNEIHRAVLGAYQIYCDDFLLCTGTPQNPEKILLIERAEDPLNGALWPIGGRAVNCPSQESTIAPLWRDHPLDASVFLSIYRESRLQPTDILEIRRLGGFHIVFQQQSHQEQNAPYNRHHPATLHAVFVQSAAIGKVDIRDAIARNCAWHTSSQLEDLFRQGKLLPHVKSAADAIFHSQERIHSEPNLWDDANFSFI